MVLNITHHNFTKYINFSMVVKTIVNLMLRIMRKTPEEMHLSFIL
jgi:hypothetical protein